jgi:putative ABC transport system ATP-binding protein
MAAFLYCGPFSATNEEGRMLYENIEISLKESTLTVLTGPSGCGKSTLLRQIVALNPTRSVRYQLQEKNFSYKELTLWRSRVTLIAQDAPVLMGSIKHNLTFPFDLKIAENKNFDQAKAFKLLQQVGLGYVDWERDASTLSGGERHRLSLVRALLWDPPVLIFDEPLSGLDQKTGELCFQLILEQARRPGRAVLCVLHDHNLSRQADKILYMSNKTLILKK